MKLRELQSHLEKQNKAQHITLAVLSNIIFEPYFQFLINKSFSKKHVFVNVISIDYVEFLLGGITKQISNSDIVAIIPNFENLYSEIFNQELNSDEVQIFINTEISNMQHIISMIRSKSNALIVWYGFEDYYYNFNSTVGNIFIQNGLVDKLNLHLYSQMKHDIVYVDMKRLIANIGISNAYDNKNKYRWNSPYSQAMIEQICDEIYRQYLIINDITKKCIVLDCDNVLWNGIISEDGIENIRLGSSGLGRSYQDFQKYLLFLYNRGVILTVCSKNDMTDVMRVFREHSEMIIKEEHIACFQVNWDNKSDNIRRIADTLNIGLDSIVFIDDSDFEIELIKQLLPEVTTIKYKYDTVYSQLSCFNLKNNIDMKKVLQRNNTYKTNERRNKLKVNSQSFEDYLNALDMKIDIHPTIPIEFARVTELTQRTNKCTNGKRYTLNEIKKRVSSNAVKLYSVFVTDRFSDLGLVGVCEIEGETLTLFSLSCRALGREIENKMLNYIEDKHKISNIMFRSTSKNSEIKKLLEETFPDVIITNCEND